MANQGQERLITKNKKAGFEYQFLAEFEAGMVLTGSEIKSIRAGKVNLSDAYCVFVNGELWVRNMHISIYKHASYQNHEPKRDRRLLLKKHELKKLLTKTKEKGLTIVTTEVLISERGYAKLGIALAKGKKLYDKREDLKAKDTKREISRAMSQV